MYKKERLAEVLHAFIAQELRSLHDPRFLLVTLTEVRPSRDYKSVKIFWTAPEAAPATSSGGASQAAQKQRELQEALSKIVPLLKRRIAEEIELRHVPDIVFSYDESAQQGARIDELLKKAGY